MNNENNAEISPSSWSPATLRTGDMAASDVLRHAWRHYMRDSATVNQFSIIGGIATALTIAGAITGLVSGLSTGGTAVNNDHVHHVNIKNITQFPLIIQAIENTAYQSASPLVIGVGETIQLQIERQNVHQLHSILNLRSGWPNRPDLHSDIRIRLLDSGTKTSVTSVQYSSGFGNAILSDPNPNQSTGSSDVLFYRSNPHQGHVFTVVANTATEGRGAILTIMIISGTV